MVKLKTKRLLRQDRSSVIGFFCRELRELRELEQVGTWDGLCGALPKDDFRIRQHKEANSYVTSHGNHIKQYY